MLGDGQCIVEANKWAQYIYIRNSGWFFFHRLFHHILISSQFKSAVPINSITNSSAFQQTLRYEHRGTKFRHTLHHIRFDHHFTRISQLCAYFNARSGVYLPISYIWLICSNKLRARALNVFFDKQQRKTCYSVSICIILYSAVSILYKMKSNSQRLLVTTINGWIYNFHIFVLQKAFFLLICALEN